MGTRKGRETAPFGYQKENSVTIEVPDKMAKARAAKAAKKETQTDMAATIAVEVAKALAGIQAAQKASEKKPDDMTPEELKKEHERLQNALEALPYVGEKVKAEPGTIIGEGLTREYVPHTREWFMDVEARRQDRNLHDGQPAELRWPNYGLHDVIYPGPKGWLDISINGVTFTVLAGVSCKLPTPHYAKYMDHIQAGRKNDERFAQPNIPGTGAGYMHVNPQTGLAVILGKGSLASIAEREASDRPE